MAAGGRQSVMSHAVDEVVLCGVVPRLDLLAATLPLMPALMVVEQVPAEWLDAEARASGLHVERFVAGQQIDPHTRGRIFSEAFECRWEPDGASGTTLQVRYIGVPVQLEALTSPAMIDLDALVPWDVHYDLWGERVDDPTVVGEPSDAPVYAELRVPRLLRYPVNGRPRRVRLRVREYIDPVTGMVALSRFCGLDEEL
jgi:hypothetical protein